MGWGSWRIATIQCETTKFVLRMSISLLALLAILCKSSREGLVLADFPSRHRSGVTSRALCMPRFVTPYESDITTSGCALPESGQKHFWRQCEVNKKFEFISEKTIASLKKYDHEAAASLLAKCEELDACETHLLSELDFIRETKRRTVYAIAVLEGESDVDKLVSSESEPIEKNSDSEGPDANEEVMCGRATIHDIIDSPSQRQAMYVIAEKNDGILELNGAAELVMAAGMSKSNVRTVSASLHNYLSNNGDFEWIAPSQFRLKSSDEIELTTGEEMAQAERNGKHDRI